jgi:hypothetical protein
VCVTVSGSGDGSSDPGPGMSAGEEDLRYRHKKFKKMATTVTAEEQGSLLSSSAAVAMASDTGGESSSGKSSPSPSVNGTGGRYVCPYCKMACAKPSVLEKHIRAHTNERPYPCVPCGFAFKTKSNLYKHCRSRAHAMKALGRDETGRLLGPDQQTLQQAPGSSEVSDPDEELEEGSPMCRTPETQPVSTPHFLNSSPGNAYSPPLSAEKQPLRPGIYKPKFHTALYNDETIEDQQNESHSKTAASPELLHRMHVERRISKIISDNQAIVETMDHPLWPRKYLQQRSREEEPTDMQSWPKRVMRQMSAGPCFSSQQENHRETPPPSAQAANSRLALALLRPKQPEEHGVVTLQGGATVTLESKSPSPSSAQQPLNLSVNNHQESRKRCMSESLAMPDVRELLVNWGQQNPHKLARFVSADTSDKNFHPQNPEGSIIKDLLLKARGGVDVSELLNNVEYPAEDTFSCTLCKISYRNAENLEIHQRYYCKGADKIVKVSAPLSPRGVNRKHSRGEEAKMAAAVELVALSTPPPFPSPGPLLGSTPLVGGYNSRGKEDSPPLKKRRLHSMSEERPPSTGSLRSLEELSRSPHGRPNSLQMFGGKVHINDGSEPKTMIIDTGRNTAPSMLSIPGMSQEDGDKGGCKSPSNIVVTIARTKLNSGGTIVQKAASSSSSTCSTTYSVSSICSSSLVPDQQLLAAVSRPIVPKITTPSLAPSLHQHPFLASQMSRLTSAFTLPPPASRVTTTPQTPRSPDPGVVTILHGGREIPYVPGMPGPQSLCGTDQQQQQQPRALDLVCSPTAAITVVSRPQLAEPK